MPRRGVNAADVTSDTQLRGFDIEVRKHVLHDYNYTVQVVGSYSELMVLIRSPHTACDVAWAMYYQSGARDRCDSSCRALDAPLIGNLTLLEAGTGTHVAPLDGWLPYRCCVDFSFAYTSLDIGIMYAAGASAPSFFAVVFQIIFEPFVVNYMAFLFMWVIVVSHLIWLVERKFNTKQFPLSYIDGIDDAVWWSIVTVTTVGYGDKSPETPLGRLVAMVWMLLGLFMFSVLSGHMSSRFVDLSATKTVTSVRDLQGLRVCSYYGYFSTWYFPEHVEFTPIERNDVVECGAELEAGNVDAIVMDIPLMADFARMNTWAKSAELSFSEPIASAPCGIVFAETANGRALNQEISPRLMEFRDTATYNTLVDQWLAPPTATFVQNTIRWDLVTPILIVLIGYLAVQCLLIVRHHREQIGKQISRFSLRATMPQTMPHRASVSSHRDSEMTTTGSAARVRVQHDSPR